MARQRRTPTRLRTDASEEPTPPRPEGEPTPPRAEQKKEDRAMDETKTTSDPMQFAGKAVETMALWADANQRILGQLVELSAGAAKESARLYAELQQTTVDVLRDTQSTALRWQSLWTDAFKDPVRFYQQTL